MGRIGSHTVAGAVAWTLAVAVIAGAAGLLSVAGERTSTLDGAAAPLWAWALVVGGVGAWLVAQSWPLRPACTCSSCCLDR